MMRILMVADIVAADGMRCALRLLPILKKEWSIDFIVANAENADAGLGVQCAHVDALIAAGVDVLTSGNHIWQNPEVFPYLEDSAIPIIRPHNYGDRAPGVGIIERHNIFVINLIARDGMPEKVDCPFHCAKKLIDSAVPDNAITLVDFHGLNPGEKKALAFYLADCVQVLVGTHTHTQTADAQLLSNGLAYISDLGMTGVLSGVQGGSPEYFIEHFTRYPPPDVVLAQGIATLQGALIEIDERAIGARSIIPISIREDRPVPRLASLQSD